MDFFKVPRWCLSIVGHNFQNPSKGWSMIFHWTALVYTATFNIWVLWFTVYGIEDLQLATASLSVSLTNMLTVGKMATFLYKKNLFTAQMEELERLINNFKAENRFILANKATFKSEQRYVALCLMTGFYFLMMPLPKMMWQQINNEPVVKELPFPEKFPFEYENVPLYAGIYIYNVIITWFVVLYAPAVDCLFYSFTIILSTQFQIFQDTIKTEKFEGAKNQLKHDIEGYVIYHNFLLKLCERVNILFKPVIIVQFFLSSLQVCLIVFQLVTYTRNFTVLIPNITFLMVILFQLFIYCYGGEIVFYESIQLNWSIQSCQWDNLPPKLRRILCYMMHRTQHPVVIEAWVYKATLGAFMVIVQTAMSYITLMRSLA